MTRDTVNRHTLVKVAAECAGNPRLRQLAECLGHEDCGSQACKPPYGRSFAHVGDHFCPHYDYSDLEFYGGNIMPVGKCRRGFYDVLNLDDEGFVRWVLERLKEL